MPMEAKPYPETKRRGLIARSVSDWTAFLGEITQGRQFIEKNLLPQKVPGFRDGRAPLEQTVPRLISKLRSEKELTHPDSAIWNAFKNAWKHWVGSHPELNNILSELVDNAADFDENGQCIEPPNSELDRGCFEILLEASRDNRIARETIQRFYEYGYFEEDEQIESLIAKALPREKIEFRKRLAALPDKVESLTQTVKSLSTEVDTLSETVKSFASRTPPEAPANGAEQELVQRIAEVRADFEAQLQQLTQQIAAVCEPFEARLSKTESSATQIVGLLKRISSLESRLSELTTSVERIDSLDTEVSELKISVDSAENKPFATEFVKIKQQVGELGRQMRQIRQDIHAVAPRLDALDEAVADIKARLQPTTGEPQIAYQALRLAESYAANLGPETEHYTDESDYLEHFRFGLARFGITDTDATGEETAEALHVALKTFSVLEIADTRVIEVWRLICGNHLHVTKINVEMGWLGVQDWFPTLFSQECFEEELARIDLSASIEKMLETGNMPWAIHLANYDRSFPESYLPSFLEWIRRLSRPDSIRIFLTRCSGTNRCETNEDIYTWVARLPKPHAREPVAARRLHPSDIVTLSEWDTWCCPHPDTDEHLGFLEQLQSAIQNNGMSVPEPIFRDIQQYLRHSQGLWASTRALDWALTFRLLPWIGNRHEFINAVQTLIDREPLELPHFQEGLQQAHEDEA